MSAAITDIPVIAAPPAAKQIELELKPSKDLPRRMKLRVYGEPDPWLSISLCGRSHGYLGGINVALSECYLDVTQFPFLAAGRDAATYCVSTTEAARIRATFPQLRVREGS